MAKKGKKAPAARKGPKGACKPTLKLKGRIKEEYSDLCKTYSEMRRDYHTLGKKAMGTPKTSNARKLYQTAKRNYKQLGKKLFKMGHPKKEWGDQHK